MLLLKKELVIKDSVILANTVIGEDSIIEYSIIDENVVIGKGVHIGSPKADDVEIAVIGRDVTIDDGSIVKQGANIEENVKNEGKEE